MIAAALSWLLRYIGWPGVLLIGLYVYEEGIPGAHRIPFLSSVPIVGDLTTGRVHAYAAEQAALAVTKATAQCEADKSQMVSKASADALAAQLIQERRMRDAATVAADEARKRVGEALRAKDEADEKVRALEAQAINDNFPTWTTEELQWYGAH